MAALFITQVKGLTARIAYGVVVPGVSRNSWAFSLQVHPRPLSETTVPKCGFASTFTHGAGVAWPCASQHVLAPIRVNPPRPLKKIKSWLDSPALAIGSARRVPVA